MGWTNPRTWVAREQPSAATFNTHIRDNLIDLNLRTVPTGVLQPYAGSSAPSGWLLADGSVVSRTTYAALFAVCGTTYNVGGESGSDFRLPNLKGRMPVGRDAAQGEFDALGETGGAKSRTLTTNELPSHAHSASTDNQGQHAHNVSIGVVGVTQTSSDVAVRSEYQSPGLDTSPNGLHGHTVTVQNSGAGNSYSQMNPYLTINYIIKT